MAQDIFEFWSRIRKGQKIHPADENAFRRIDAERHGFRLECLPGSYGGRLRTAPVVLLFLSPGFAKKDLKDAKDKDAREYYFQKLKGNTPLRDQPGNPGTNWIMSRTRHFGAWEDVRNNVAVLNIGAYHSKTFNDYSVLASLPSSRVSLEWASNIDGLFADGVIISPLNARMHELFSTARVQISCGILRYSCWELQRIFTQPRYFNTT